MAMATGPVMNRAFINGKAVRKTPGLMVEGFFHLREAWPTWYARYYPIVIPVLAVTPLQVTLTVPVPGLVAVPIFQDHETRPLLSAVLLSRPAALLTVPAGVI